MDVPIGKVVYTGLFNHRGTFESDLCVVRLAADEFSIVTGAGQTVRDFDWIRRNVRDDEHAEIVDVTNAYGVIGVMGPNSRRLLSRITDADLSNDDFPFGTAQRIAVGRATALAVRITYVGELGWELHVSSDQTGLAYDTIMSAGADLGVTDAGHYAINSLRLEKGYRAWGPDLSCDDSPLEAGLGFAVSFEKATPFLGREALLKQKAAGIRKRLASFVVQDPGQILWGGERIFRDGECVGYTTSAAYGHVLGGAVALGYVRRQEPVTAEWVRAGRYTIDVAGTQFPAAVSLTPPYDPTGARIRL
jgi:4-methylaminobutanoate oxidase (formaldehyde-forming)